MAYRRRRRPLRRSVSALTSRLREKQRKIREIFISTEKSLGGTCEGDGKVTGLDIIQRLEFVTGSLTLRDTNITRLVLKRSQIAT